MPARPITEARARASRLVTTVLLLLAVLSTGWMLWRSLQPGLLSDSRRDLLLDAGNVRLLEGFDDTEALFTWSDEKATNPDRDAIAIPVRRVSRLLWEGLPGRPGRFRAGVARLVVGEAGDDTPCTLTVSVADGTDAGSAPLPGGGSAAGGTGEAGGHAGGEAAGGAGRARPSVEIALPPCPALPGAHPAQWREGPPVDVVLELPEGAPALLLELRAPEGVPDGAAAALLSPRLEQAPLHTPLESAVHAVTHSRRLLPDVPPPAAPDEPGACVRFARRTAVPAAAAAGSGAPAGGDPAHALPGGGAADASGEEVLLPPVETVAAFTGADGRPAVALTGAASVEWVVDVEPGSVLRTALALDDRLPAGAQATVEVLLDGQRVQAWVADAVRWQEVELPLDAHAGAARRLTLRLVQPQLEPATVTHADVDLIAGALVDRAYTAELVRVGLEDPRLERGELVPVRRATSGRPSVILIQVETLRADELQPAVAPVLQDFAAAAAVWERAFTPSPWTLPTTVSLFTGLLPGAHGAVDHDRLLVPGDAATLAELAARAGIATGAVVASDLLRPQAGFARGFQSYAHVPYANARQVNDLARAFLENHAGRQFFLFLHYFDPHAPYNAPGEWRDRFVDPELRGRDFAQALGRLIEAMRAAQVEGRAPTPDEADLRFLRGRYRGEIAYFDSQFRVLLDTLNALRLDGSTIVALTADHGEEFFEHGLLGHGSDLFDETLHVPLLVRGPKGTYGLPLPGSRDAAPIGTVGLFASVLRWLDVPFDVQGVRPPLDRAERVVFSETCKGIALDGRGDALRRHLLGTRGADARLVWSTSVDGEAGPGHVELYDLRADPRALFPLPMKTPPGPQLWEALQQALQWSAQHRVAAPTPGGDAALLQDFQALGYVGEAKPGK